MKVAVTGATGFIGQYVVERLRSNGHTVVAIGRSESKLQKTFSTDHLHIHPSDYTVESLQKGFKEADTVVHLAAVRKGYDNTLDLESVFDTNIRITRNVFRATMNEAVRYVCQSSSIAVYPLSSEVPFFEGQRPQPPNMYGLSKVVCENIGEIVQHNEDITVSSLRLGSVFGPGERHSDLLMKFIERAKKNEPLVVYGAGESARDFVYIQDVVSAFESAVESETGDIFNIGSGKSVSISDIAEQINKVFNNKESIQYDKSKTEDGQKYYMDCSKAERELDWAPKFSLEDALKEMKTEDKYKNCN